MKKQRVVGLLGGIGSGKSTVAAVLSRHGAFVFDADRFTGKLLNDPQVVREIRKVFGEKVLCRDGSVDKTLIADRVFSDKSDRDKIQAIIHPRVRTRVLELVAETRELSPDKVIVLDIPLLLGSRLRSLCDLLVMILAPLESRLARVKKSRGWSLNELKRRESCQASIREKEEAADMFINNNGNVEDLEKEVKLFLRTLTGYEC